MAHFAQLDENNIVTNVIVVNNDDAPDPFPESEITGQQFIASLGLEGVWKQTSYNATIRKNYAGIGYTYDYVRDAFIAPKPDGDGWVLNEDSCLWEEVIESE